MSTVTHVRSRPLDPWRLLGITVTVVIAVLMLGHWLSNQTAERRAIVRLPVEQREKALSSALRTLETLCGKEIPSDLERYCAEQAMFVAQFPECDAACHARVDPILRHHPNPTR